LRQIRHQPGQPDVIAFVQRHQADEAARASTPAHRAVHIAVSGDGHALDYSTAIMTARLGGSACFCRGLARYGRSLRYNAVRWRMRLAISSMVKSVVSM